MVFRIIFLAAIVVGMAVFLYDKWSADDTQPETVSSQTAVTDPVAAIRSKTPAQRRPNSSGLTGAGYKFEYQDENGRWIPVMEFSQIPSRYRGHFRPINQQSAAADQSPAVAPAAQAGSQPPPPQPGAAPAEKDKGTQGEGGPSQAEKALSDFQKKQAENEIMYKEWGGKCRQLSEQLGMARKAWDEIKDKLPPCQLKEEDCYQKYEEYKAKLNKDVTDLTRADNECREGARKAGVPPGYLR